MEEKKNSNIDIHRLWLIFLRRKWFFVIPIAAFIPIGVLVAVALPEVYESKTVLLVEQSKVMQGVFDDKSGFKADAHSLVKVVREMMLGWVPVTSMLRETGFLSEKEYERGDAEVEELYRDIISRVRFNTKSNDLIEISFQDKQPLIAYRVLEGLVSNFMERFLGRVRAQVDSTLNFIQKDLKRLREKLDESEEQLRVFEEQNFSELPGGMNTLSELNKWRDDLWRINLDISIQKERMALLDEGIKNEGKTILGEVVKVPNPKVEEIKKRIDQLESALASMHAKYYDTHPAIAVAQKELASLKKKLQEEDSEVVGAKKTVSNPVRQEIVAKRYDEEMKLKALELRKKEISATIARLEESMKSVPAVKKKLTDLRRNYDVIKGLYNNRLAQQSTEELRREMSMYAMASPFTMIEPPRIPKQPVKATRIKVLLISVFLGLAIGIGLIFLTEQLDQRFKGVDDAREFLQIPLLGVVPTIMSAEDLLRERRKKWRTLIVVGAASGAVAIFLAVFVLVAHEAVEKGLDKIQNIVG